MASDWLDRIHWSADGLIPVVTQESGSGRVLTMAWANREALQRTAETLEQQPQSLIFGKPTP